MSVADLRLGLRLAGGGGARERLRAGSVVLAGALATTVLLSATAIAHAAVERGLRSYSTDGMPQLMTAVLAAVAVPVVVLVATVARLSATVRDRRLGVLRLIGLSAQRTRLVAAVESGAGIAVGSAVGAVVFALVRPTLRHLPFADARWPTTELTPWPSAALAVILGVPAVAVLAGLAPTARLGARSHRQSLSDGSRRPSLVRLAPLAVGLSVTVATTTGVNGDDVSDSRAYAFIAGAALSGLGVVLVVPVFTRLLADLMVRWPGGPSLRIAGRRLQAQPAGVSRIVAGLLVAMFLASGGRMIVGAWEDLPEYRSAAQAMHDGPARYQVIVPKSAGPDAVVARLRTTDGVQKAFVRHARAGVIIVRADSGSPSIERRIDAIAKAESPRAGAIPMFDRDEYTFVVGLRSLVWTVAAIALGIGLLGFAIATIDRTLTRRGEMVALQIVGTPRRVIRAAQWWEAALPLAVGLPLAVALGWGVGSGYLALGGSLSASPLHAVLALGLVGLVVAAVMGGLTVLACAPRVRADLIRRV